jgi:hypothetical protein
VRCKGGLELPLGAGDWNPSVDAAIFFRGQRRAEPRPQNQDENIRFTRRQDGVLEMPGRQHRFGFPEVRLDVEETRVVLGELFNDQCRPSPLR